MTSEWKPMETAPKDGTPILLLSPDGHVGIGVIEISSYSVKPYGRAVWSGQRPYSEGSSVWLGGTDPLDAAGWQPLPSRPHLVAKVIR